MEKAITTRYIAYSNLKKKKFRTSSLILIIALNSFVILGCLIFSASLKSGINGISSRIGSDLMIVPEGYESKMEGILLYGTPEYFYMNRDIEKSVCKVSEVEAASSQVYLTSVSETCCDFPVQIIGFDNESDFIIKNWAAKKISAKTLKSMAEAGDEILLAGHNVNVQKNTVRFFGMTHNVLGKLDKSGSGMDNMIYTDFQTLKKIFFDAREKGFNFISGDDIETKISVIFVKLKEGSKPDAAALKILDEIEKDFAGTEKVRIIQGEKFIQNLMQKLSSILIFLYAICILVFLISFMTLSLVFSLSLNERIKEFSILRVLGADFSKLKQIIFTEAIVLGSGGALGGIFFSLLVIIPFNTLIAEKIDLPFAMSGTNQLVLFSFAVFVISTLSAILSSLFSTVKISHLELYGEIK